MATQVAPGAQCAVAAAAVPCVSSSRRSTAGLCSFGGLRPLPASTKMEKSLRDALKAVPASRRGGAMAAQMVAAPATRGADVEFTTDVFTKEKITPAGRDEVCWTSVSSFVCLLLRFGLVSGAFCRKTLSNWGFWAWSGDCDVSCFAATMGSGLVSYSRFSHGQICYGAAGV